VIAVGLERAGVPVVCVARPGTADVIGSDGLTLRHGEEVETVRPEVTTDLRESVELLLVTVKAPALDDALGRIHEPAETIVPLLNGIEHVQTIRNAFPSSRVVAGTIGFIEAWLERPGVVVQNTPRTLMTISSGAGEETADLLRRSGVEVRVDGSEEAVLWEKLARQAPVAAATALTQLSIGELRSDPLWRRRLEDAVVETCRVALADGVALTPEAQWEIIDAMPPGLTSSTARDIAAGRPSELDAITGAAVRAAQRLGVPAPVLESLLEGAEEACRARSH
jgi:2-dehydropantoate 2-reductase